MKNIHTFSLKLNKLILIFIPLILITASFSLLPFLANGQTCDPKECERTGGTCQFDNSFERKDEDLKQDEDNGYRAIRIDLINE